MLIDPVLLKNALRDVPLVVDLLWLSWREVEVVNVWQVCEVQGVAVQPPVTRKDVPHPPVLQVVKNKFVSIQKFDNLNWYCTRFFIEKNPSKHCS